jgi:hypothetical protein
MRHAGVKQGGRRDGRDNDAKKDATPNKTVGEEGTNKTQPQPDPNAQPADVPGSGKHMEPSPFVR